MRVCALVLGTLLLATGASAATDRTYTNPVADTLSAADPFVMHYGDRYYLYPTSAGDGYRCWVSSDLVHWLPLGYVYRRAADTWGRHTFWAPSVAQHNGRFYMAYSAVHADSQGYRICLAQSDRPEGPFQDIATPLFDMNKPCIDADLFIDSGGAAWLYFNCVAVADSVSSSPTSKIFGVRLASDLRSTAGTPTLLLPSYQPWEDSSLTGAWCNEGAHVFRANQTYYLTFTAGSYLHPGYSIGVATSKAPLGPWTKAATNPLISHARTPGVCGPGHNSVTTSPDGSELFIAYHTHYSCERVGPRPLCIDRLHVGADGSVTTDGPTQSSQLMPSGAPPALTIADLAEPLAARCREELRREAIDRTRLSVMMALEQLSTIVSGSGERYRFTLPAVNRCATPVVARFTWRNVPGIAPASSEVRLAPGASGKAGFSLTAPQQSLVYPTVAWVLTSAGDTIGSGLWRLACSRTGVYATAGKSDGRVMLIAGDSSRVVVGRDAWNGPTDCSATAVLDRCGDTLRVTVDVTDDSICTSWPQVWDNDGVELYFDVRPIAKRGTRPYGPGVMQLAFVPDLAAGTCRMARNPPKPAALAGVSTTCERTVAGYRVRIVLAPQAFDMLPGQELNFDWGVNDADTAERESQLMWSGTRDNWGDARGFGRMRPVR